MASRSSKSVSIAAVTSLCVIVFSCVAAFACFECVGLNQNLYPGYVTEPYCDGCVKVEGECVSDKIGPVAGLEPKCEPDAYGLPYCTVVDVHETLLIREAVGNLECLHNPEPPYGCFESNMWSCDVVSTQEVIRKFCFAY